MSQTSATYFSQADIMEHRQQNLILGVEILIATITGVAIIITILCLLNRCRGRSEIIVVQSEAPEQPASKNLTEEEINEFIPKMQHTKSENKFQSNTCAICLEDFSVNYMIRKIPICEHIFHAVCIEAWLGRHQNCPDCRQELNRADFEKFKKLGKLSTGNNKEPADVQTEIIKSKPQIVENSQQAQQPKNVQAEPLHQVLIQIT